MRTIKFRGKTIRSKEWVYSSTISQGTIKRKANKWFMEISENVWKGLQEGSLGQFTGLYDKNGKEIYEGDIVDAWSAGGHLPNGIIKWGEGIAGFFIMSPKCNAVWHLVGDNENKETLEIIGNIHDNPELLKGGNHGPK